jgi:hypothetical protein
VLVLYAVILLLSLKIPGEVPGLEFRLFDIEELGDRNTLFATLCNG